MDDTFCLHCGRCSSDGYNCPSFAIHLGLHHWPCFGALLSCCSRIFCFQAVINIYGVRAAALTNLVAVGAEIFSMAVFGLLLLVVILVKGHPNTELLTTIPPEPKPYLSGFLMSVLLGAWTIIGFEGAVDISEETVNVKRIAPKGIISAVLVCGVVGFLFLAVITLGITDLPATQASDNPLSLIFSHYLGGTITKILLVFVLISVWACSLVNMTGASRVLFAMSRDKRFVASKWFQKISSHYVPNIAVWFVAYFASWSLCFSQIRPAAYSAGTALLSACLFLRTVISFAVNVKNSRHQAHFIESLAMARRYFGSLMRLPLNSVS